MPMPIPPLQPHPDLVRKRIANGARTMKEIDPAFHAWVQQFNRIATIQATALVIGAIGIAIVGMVTILNSL